uniref:hypothetical protein n=1 Tax=uncultured Bartonella sp. TaxID=104108 RepID=UPI0025EBEB9F
GYNSLLSLSGLLSECSKKDRCGSPLSATVYFFVLGMKAVFMVVYSTIFMFTRFSFFCQPVIGHRFLKK